MHPFTPFITEELWSFFKDKNQPDLIVSMWPNWEYNFNDDVDGAMTVLQELITSIRAIRSRMNIAPSKNVDLKIKCSKDQSDLISQNKKLFMALAKIDSYDLKYDWDNIWINSKDELAQYEKVFEQDLNGDEAIGFDTSALNDITTDVTGATLKTSAEGQVFIIDGSKTIDIKDSYGGVPYLSSSYSYDGFSMTQTPYAVEEINEDDDTYYFIYIINFFIYC